ncbi:hypothetical protein TNCV_1798101 [Trichonephila clavipes]|nr:hypothetical protein TNCV_1798101 [Trichonephila clavipes]
MELANKRTISFSRPNCHAIRLEVDEKVSRNEREVTLEKQKIELAKVQLAQLEKEIELQTAKNKALSLNPAAKVEEKQFETLNKETAIHIGIREAEDWFRPIDLAKRVCDIYISSKNGSLLVCSVFFVCFRFSSGLDEKGKKRTYRCGQRTVRLADCGSQKPSSLRAQAQLMRTETCGLLKTLEKLEENDRGARAGVTFRLSSSNLSVRIATFLLIFV